MHIEIRSCGKSLDNRELQRRIRVLVRQFETPYAHAIKQEPLTADEIITIPQYPSFSKPSDTLLMNSPNF